MHMASRVCLLFLCRMPIPKMQVAGDILKAAYTLANTNSSKQGACDLSFGYSRSQVTRAVALVSQLFAGGVVIRELLNHTSYSSLYAHDGFGELPLSMLFSLGASHEHWETGAVAVKDNMTISSV